MPVDTSSNTAFASRHDATIAAEADPGGGAGKGRRPMSARRKLRLARTILVALVVVALVVGASYETLSPRRDVRSSPSLEDLAPDGGRPPPPSAASPISGVEALAIPPRAKGGTIPGEWTYAITVEKGMPDGDGFATFVDRILADPRGWSQKVRFRRAAPGESPMFTIFLASPSNVDRLCAPLSTDGAYSCGLDGRAVVNALRWRDGPVETAREAWSGESLDAYRTMVVNHEVGHVLGLGHQGCSAAGAPSSIMAQQTIDLKGCRPNPWPRDEDVAALRR